MHQRQALGRSKDAVLTHDTITLEPSASVDRSVRLAFDRGPLGLSWLLGRFRDVLAPSGCAAAPDAAAAGLTRMSGGSAGCCRFSET